MSSLIIENKAVKQYTGQESTVMIPSGIRRIDEYAFSGSSIEQIEFQDNSLKMIGNKAFLDAYNLKEVVLPNAVRNI